MGIITDKAAINELGIKMLMAELAFEIKTGMKKSRNYSPLKLAQQLGYPGRKKLDAILWLIKDKQVEPMSSTVEFLATQGYEILIVKEDPRETVHFE